MWDRFWSWEAEDYVEGWLPDGRPFCAEHLAEADRAARLRRLQELLGPFPRMRNWSFDTFPAGDDVGAAARVRARRWLDGDYGDRELCPLFIFGGVGSGKTSLALSCLRAYVVENHGWGCVRLFNMRQLLADTRRSFGRKDTADPTDEVDETDFAALDDIGAERPTPWAVETLATIVDQRYVREQPTIVTSNYAPSELAKRLGHEDPVIGLRIVSRLTENAVQIRLDRPDLRLHGELEPDDDEGDDF